MNKLAEDLNNTLKDTAVYDLLSDYGKRMYVPKGIIVQSSEAKQKANKYNATIGIALEHGAPMFNPEVREMFTPSLTPGEIFPYAPMGGVMALRKKWLEEIYDKNPSAGNCKMSLPVVCSGLTNALSLVCSLFVEKGDSLILPDMYWENYNLIIDEQRQARKILFPLFENGGFNLNGLRNALDNAGAKATLILNFPNNPTGYTLLENEAVRTAEMLKEYAEKGMKLTVISDDAYFGLFFEDDVTKESIFAKLCNLHENILAVKCDAATKEEMAWGFRVAFITYAAKGLEDKHLDALCQKTMGALRGSLSSCSMSAQNILFKALSSPSHKAEKEKGVNRIKERYVALKNAILQHSNDDILKPIPFNSGYFMSFETKCNAEQLRQHLLENYGTGTICHNEHVLRLAFSAVDVENIEPLLDIVYQAANDLR